MESRSQHKKLNVITGVTRGCYRFFIMDSPTDVNVNSYVAELKAKRCKCIVRTCQPSYSDTVFERAGIAVVELPFSDGGTPCKQLITHWLALLQRYCVEGTGDDRERKQPPGVAVHCVSGLGRAPLLVCIALIEDGMEPLDAIEFVRKRRRGALNHEQIEFLSQYRPHRSSAACACVIL